MRHHKSGTTSITQGRRGRRGVTIVECVVCLAILLLTVSMTTAGIFASREEARSTQCKSNMKDLGIAFHTFADRDPQGRLCSGAVNARTDGSPDTYGWCSDVVAIKAGSPSRLRCPSNPLRNLETIAALQEDKVTDAFAPADRQNKGLCGMLNDLSPNTAENQKKRDQLIRKHLSEKLTNYAASWHFVRSAPKLKSADGKFLTDLSASPKRKWRALQNTRGPLTFRLLERGVAPACNVALLGDAAPGDVAESLLVRTLGTSAKAGDRLAESFGDGPVYWDAKAKKFQTPEDKTPAKSLNPRNFPKQGQAVTAAMVDRLTESTGQPLFLQDTRHWFAVHDHTLNLLMGDGSVKSIRDMNGDGYLNPGFPVSGKQAGLKFGYADNICEINPFDVFSGTLIDTSFLWKASFGED